jgi:glucosamine--fructose-6-phosphate aminotransferase (isomerizing)
MCGIVGGLSYLNMTKIVVEGLKKLEYRGYDSVGIAYLENNQNTSKLTRIRCHGRVKKLEEALIDVPHWKQSEQNDVPNIAIGHTRWATHGVPNEQNSHPHISHKDDIHIAVVHNGIIENHESLRLDLQEKGYVFTSDTDTEVIAHLIHWYATQSVNTQSVTTQDVNKNSFDLLKVSQQAIAKCEGLFAIAVISEQHPFEMVATRREAPLVLGVGQTLSQQAHEVLIASDPAALLQRTNQMVYLQNNDWVHIHDQYKGHYQIFDKTGFAVLRPVVTSQLSIEDVSLGKFQHYMQKEIFEQPIAIANTLEALSHRLQPELFGVHAKEDFQHIQNILILACGSSYYAGLVAKQWFEEHAKIPCQVEIASEYRYRHSVVIPHTLVIAISQSGETADTLAAVEHTKNQGMTDILAICNVPESSLMRHSKHRFLTRAGAEIGVASTKAFLTQLVSLWLLVLTMAKLKNHLSEEQEKTYIHHLDHLPSSIYSVLGLEEQIKTWAHRFAVHDHALFLGRGTLYPIASEGALKLKEITYIHAESYAAGELKHGPLALIDEHMPVVVVAPNNQLVDKLRANMQEVKARGGQLYVFADASAHIKADDFQVIELLDHAPELAPILHTIPLQLLAYHVALVKGTDVDKPRNLAKSVTVE